MKDFDFAVQQDVERYIDEMVFPFIRATFDKCGVIAPMAQLFCTRDKRGFSFKDSRIGVMVVGVDSLRDGTDKDAFAEFVGRTVTRHRAIGVIMVFESWMLFAPGAEEGQRIAAEGGSLEHHPQRKEIIFISVEHIRFQACWHVPIVRDGKGHGTLDAAVRWSDMVGWVGRFAGLLHKERFS